MQKTTNYGLNQWEKSDRIQMEDFNSDNAKIDATLAAQAEALGAAAAKMGNCRIETGTYVGVGKYGGANKLSLTFSGTPSMVIITGENAMIALRGNKLAPTTNMHYANLTWTDNSLSWYSDNVTSHMNANSTTYYYIAFLKTE